MTRARVRRALAVVALAGGLVPGAGEPPAAPTWTVAGGTAALDSATGPALVATGGTVTATTAEVTFAGEILLPAGSADPAPPSDTADVPAPSVEPGGDPAVDDDDAPAGHARLTQVQVLVDGDEGTLLADVTAPADGGEPLTSPGVALGAIDLTGHPLTVSDGAASLSGAPVTLTADGAPTVGREPGAPLGSLDLTIYLTPATRQPEDVVAHAGEDAHFAVTAPAGSDVRWQSRPDALAEWQDLTGSAGPDLTLPAVSVAQDGTQVRAVVGVEPGVLSDAATLTVPAPTVQLLADDGETPLGEVRAGDAVVVRGTGFGPAANAGGTEGTVPHDLPQGTVVALGAFADHWRPSEGAPAGSRTAVTQVRALAADVLEQVPTELRGTGQWVELATDGSFTATLVVAAPERGWPEDGVPGVYTYPAGGATNPDQELGVPLSLVPPAPGPSPLEPTAEPAPEPPAAAPQPAAVGVSAPEAGPGDLPEWPAALRTEATPPAAEAAEPVTQEPAAAQPRATTADSLPTLVMLVVVVLLGGALVAGSRERG
ncbi:HtaA domain-containing protein [Georgenia sp. H159]|uniref:HtaA domain-containing protein n=1 Tax=Georgenia sp. H159 TaxID=3076115 RepID=UPI002D78611C|nr:HtaA domain-containing protein [Georgenia sp. H159]